MQRINTPDGQFHAGDPSTGALGTIVTRDFAQSLQEEIAGTVEFAGLALDPADNGQLIKAIGLLILRQALGRYLGTQIIRSTQTYTPGIYNGVTASKARFRGTAAGGGSGGNPATNSSQAAISGAGNAGNAFDFWIISGLKSMPITVGAPGAAGAAGAHVGGNGGNLLIGSIATIIGGLGGLAGVASSSFPFVGPIGSLNAASTIASAGGVTVDGILNILGQIGGNGTLFGTGAANYGGGGTSAYGCAGASGSGASGYGVGAGGIASGANAAAAAGFPGMPAILLADEFA